MVAFIIFGGFALVRCIGRVFLIPVLAARSASVGRKVGDGHNMRLCHGAGRTECICKSRQTLFVSGAVSW